MRSLQILAIILFLLLLFPGCGGTKATVFVHNDSKKAIRVDIVGFKENLYVGPGKHTKQDVRYGEYKIVVRSGKKVIFEDTKEFKKSDKCPNWRHYLLDPHADTRYVLREVYFYKDRKKAKNGKSSKRIKSLPKQHWVEVPVGASDLSPGQYVLAHGNEEVSKRLCVTSK